ncbi:hypothetical protein C808_04983 [Lachnospiraceae bacterium M18-1]|nr:hypothetical protein C808_04983 [Lachnospiraceae bacterium M18-1]
MTDNNLTGQQVQGYTITKKLGSGGYGTVYLGVKEDLGKQYRTAIKHISIPDAEGYDSVLQDYGYDKAAAQAHFEKMVEGITSEINTLLELSKKDNRYIVAYYDHDIQKTLDPFHFDIFMRMEYLTPLNRYIRQNGFTVGDIIKLGLNMCDALTLCHNSGIIHRDIKEANIFVNEDGQYKLGDFGVAKAEIEMTQSGSIKGTASYMAPEIYLREPYDSSVDIYSLGIVLYKLLNCQRLPFMPDAPALFTADDKNAAESRRLKGDTPPLPVNAKDRLGEIVVKACSVKSERYTNAEDFKKDLQEFLSIMSETEYDRTIITQAAVIDETLDSGSEKTEDSYTQTQGATMTMGAQSHSQSASVPSSQNPYAEKSKKPKKRLVIATVVGVAVIAAGVAGYLAVSRITDPVRLFQEAIQENDFEKASQLYENKLKSGNSGKLAEASDFLSDHAEDVLEKYIQGELEYEDALSQLQEMEKIGIVSEGEMEPLIEELNEIRTSRAAYENGQDEMEAGDYEAAIGDFRKVIQDDPNYSNAQKKLADAVRSYKDELIVSLSQFETDKRYRDAISALSKGLIVVPEDADFQEKIRDYEKKIEDDITLTVDGIIRDAKGIVSESEDYTAALTDLRAAQKQYPNREELKTAIGEMEEAYVSKQLTEAEKLAGESRYEEAVDLLGEAQELVPDNDSMEKAIKEYKAKFPTLLQQMVYFTGEYLENGGQELDNLQGTQKNIVTNENGYAFDFDNIYKLNGTYKKMTGNWYQPFSERSSTNGKDLKIYGDGRLLFSATMRSGIEPIGFEIDLAGVEELEIILSKTRGSNYSGYAKLANVQFYQ